MPLQAALSCQLTSGALPQLQATWPMALTFRKHAPAARFLPAPPRSQVRATVSLRPEAKVPTPLAAGSPRRGRDRGGPRRHSASGREMLRPFPGPNGAGKFFGPKRLVPASAPGRQGPGHHRPFGIKRPFPERAVSSPAVDRSGPGCDAHGVRGVYAAPSAADPPGSCWRKFPPQTIIGSRCPADRAAVGGYLRECGAVLITEGYLNRPPAAPSVRTFVPGGNAVPACYRQR